ncbi:MAG: DNA methyltransferase [Myxococcales bacterium]|nr:DNA methyltransferase [Myxococcales bacterium]
MIKYLGSKRLLLGAIDAAVGSFGESLRVLDLFSGTSRVGHALKRSGHFVVANDHLAFAATLARCYVQADARVHRERAAKLIAELDRLPGEPGYVTETFCERARYFKPENGARIDAIRERIAALSLEPELEAIALTSLLEAADRVDSTTGVQMAYLKQWAPRASQPLALRLPAILDGTGQALCMDALDAASTEVDVAYLDPPYNQHRYIGNYHVWETLVRWDKPEVYGVACKRVQAKDHKSEFNSKRTIASAMSQVLAALRAKHMIVSFNDEGYLSRDELVGLLSSRGHVEIVAVDFKRYVGAQIGIYNPAGEKVGKVRRLRNVEYLFVVSEEKDRAEEAAQAARQALASGGRSVARAAGAVLGSGA